MSAVPAWIEAVATVLALIAASAAAFFSWRAFRRDHEQDARSAAQGLSAWWATGDLDDSEVWGIVLANTSPVVFRDILVMATGNNHPASQEGVRSTALPPGYYFVESNSRSAPKAWGPKVTLGAPSQLNPLTDARTRAITEIQFTDNRGARWSWRPATGLVRKDSASRAASWRNAG